MLESIAGERVLMQAQKGLTKIAFSVYCGHFLAICPVYHPICPTYFFLDPVEMKDQNTLVSHSSCDVLDSREQGPEPHL